MDIKIIGPNWMEFVDGQYKAFVPEATRTAVAGAMAQSGITIDAGTNPFHWLVAQAVSRGITGRDVSDDTMEFSGITNQKKLTLDFVKLLVAFGAEVEDYPAWVVLTDTQLNQEVPGWLPGKEKRDENGDVIGTLKWFEWGGTIQQWEKDIDDNVNPLNYVKSYNRGWLSGSVLVQLIDANVPVLSNEDMKMVQANNPAEI